MKVIGIAALITLLMPMSALAEERFAPGEIVEVSAYGKPEDAKVVRQDASGVLVLQKDWQDGTFKPNGPSRYYSASEVKHKNAAPANQNVDAGGGRPNATAAAAQPAGQPAGGAADLAGTGPLSKQQIIDYLKARIGTDGPHPQKEAVCKTVVEAIKQRGAAFKYKSSDGSEFAKAGADTTVTYALQDNLGEAVKMPWLLDEWDLWFTTTAKFTPSLESGAKYGFLSIEADHKYLWKIHANDPPKTWIDGHWREATPAEMKYQGGVGIVLLDGEQGYDWIVVKDQSANRGEEWIKVADIETRQMVRGGQRKK